MSDVARAAGVSKNAVSLALRSDPSIPAQTRDRIRAHAVRIGYTCNPVVAHLMSELRRSESGQVSRTIALLNAYPLRDAFRRHPTLPALVEGCLRRAREQGYGVDEFWLHEPGLTGPALDRMLATRGIRAAVVIGLMRENRLPPGFESTWRNHVCVVAGIRTRDPELPFCAPDHHRVVLRALEEIRIRGYRRPALVLDPRIDYLVEGRLEGAFWIGQRMFPAKNRIAPFRCAADSSNSPELFRRWLARMYPDVILSIIGGVERWILEAGLRIPQDIGLVTLERRPDLPHQSGIDQCNEITGEAAVDLAIAQLHRGEIGPPRSPRSSLIEGVWVEGRTLRTLPKPAST